ncbi:long-chain-fatty-acid--CoA ligase [Rhodococcus sp. NM-2]|uniref:long-chain-fatty-acid--CoA ligase n=1 Tax=Rhodococcus sp. NM-2 TaxID=3401174 RepID=UPI003AAA9027
MTISDQLARHARSIPDKVAYQFEGVDRTYSELDARVNRLANGLRDRGVGHGDRVALLTLNNLETVETFFACARLGAIAVPVNFRLVVDEVAYILDDCGATTVIVDASLAAVVAKARVRASTVQRCLVIGGQADAGPETETFDDVVRHASSTTAEIEVDEKSPAFIMYTSGTTGRPKGAVLTHHNLGVHTVSNMIHLGLPPDCRVWLTGTPLFHVAGVAGLLPSLFVGGRMVVMPMGAFDPGATVDLLERERINMCFFVPAQWQAICGLPDIGNRELSALRLISWGAAPATRSLLTKIIDTFPHAKLYSAFGQTECSPITAMLLGEDALRKMGSIGTPMVNVEVRIVDAGMNDVPVGEVGEIVYRGPTIMKEYWNKPEESVAAFSGGWFHSGDLVRQDEDGFLYVVDRLKDMIISGAENIYSSEVEDAVACHPKVAEVSVVGVPDPKWGEVPVAVVVPTMGGKPPTFGEIDGWCRERLAAYKCPRHLLITDVLPRNASGKVLKTALREEINSRIGR